MRSFFRSSVLFSTTLAAMALVIGCGADAGGDSVTDDDACPAGSHGDDSGVCVATLDAWKTATPLSDARDHHVTFVVETQSGAYLYAAAGAVHAASPVTSIERARIAEDGSLGAWETLGTELEMVGGSVAVGGRQVLLAGGFRGEAPSAKTDVATVSDDGSLALEPGPDMLSARFHHSLVHYKTFVYSVGGFRDDQVSIAAVDRASFHDEHGVGPWQEDTPLPTPRSHHAMVAYRDALYVVAGLNRQPSDSASGYLDENFADVLRAAIRDDGSLGEWKVVGHLAAPLAIHAAFVHLDRLYVVGGLEGPSNGGTFVSRVRRATFEDDGTLGEFEELPSELPLARGHCHQAPLSGTTVYSVGGAAEMGIHMESQREAFAARLE